MMSKKKISIIIILASVIISVLFMGYILGSLTPVDYFSTVHLLVDQAKYDSTKQYVQVDNLVRNYPILRDSLDDVKSMPESQRYGEIISASITSLKNSDARELIIAFENISENYIENPEAFGYHITYEGNYYAVAFVFCNPDCGPYL